MPGCNRCNGACYREVRVCGCGVGHIIKARLVIPSTLELDPVCSIGRQFHTYFVLARSSTIFDVAEDTEQVVNRAGGLGRYGIRAPRRQKNPR